MEEASCLLLLAIRNLSLSTFGLLVYDFRARVQPTRSSFISEGSSMQSRCSGFLLLITLFVTFPAWGQMIQSAPVQNAPAQNAPVQPAPQPSPQSGHNNGGDFSDVTNPNSKNV